ncbi:MAG TPA: YraN family protein [Phnomibacter sp.]|nr:YraN family protein [Phnomibacter sp.]
MEKPEKTSQQLTGALGENLAADFLVGKGFELLHRNWRSGKSEVDIIASKEGMLHFFEIKTRRDKHFGLPETKVNTAKLLQLKKGAEAYLVQYPQWKFIQFDIISINLEAGKSPEIFMINDVF